MMRQCLNPVLACTGRALVALATGCALAWPVAAMAADAPAAPPRYVFRTVPATPMTLPAPVPLGAPTAGQPFQWTGLPNERILRNVTSATLYLVKPEAGRANGRAVLVVPGGGYKFVAIENEGLPVARRLAEAGYTAAVLVYRVQPTPAADEGFAAMVNQEISERFARPQPVDTQRLEHPPAVEDAKAAMRWLRAHAAELSVDAARIGYIGFSAGAHSGHLLAQTAEPAEMPATLALIYGGMQAVQPRQPVPPLFIAQALDDPLFPLTHINLVHSWQRAGQRVEVHLYERGSHGFGLIPRGTTSDGWMDAYLAWLARQ